MSEQPHWFVELIGDLRDVRDVVQLAPSSGLDVADHDAKPTLDVLGFDWDADPAEVLRAAEDEVRALNGLGRTFLQNWRGFKVAALRRRERRKPPTAYILPKGIPSGERFGLPRVSVAGAPVDARAESRGERALALSRSDEEVRKVLRLLGADPLDYRQLYVVYEVIENACKGMDGVVRLGVSSKAELRRFKHTANSVAALQDEARHGKELAEPPRTPMSLEQARELIRHLTSAWIDGMNDRRHS